MDREGLQESWNVTFQRSLRRGVEVEFAVVDQVGVNSQM